MLTFLLFSAFCGVVIAQDAKVAPDQPSDLTILPMPPYPRRCEDILPLILILCIENAQVGCIGCDRTCDQYLQGVQCRPGRVDSPQCFCKPGYYKLTEDPGAPCVPADQCPKRICNDKVICKKQKVCGCNEVAKCSGCDNRCQPWSTSPCTERYYDEGRCFCKDGYIRFADGNCKPKNECQVFQ